MYQNYKNFKEWAIGQHTQTNHFYDGDFGDPTALPYSYHLQLVVDVIYKFRYLIEALHEQGLCPSFKVIVAAAWGHDLIEDARSTYSKVFRALLHFGFSKNEAKEAVEIMRAVTNYGRGRNREERMPDFVYADIFSTPGAVIVKCADRAGNLKHGLLKGSSQKKMYEEENPHFKKMLYKEELKPMFDYIEKFFTIEL